MEDESGTMPIIEQMFRKIRLYKSRINNRYTADEEHKDSNFKIIYSFSTLPQYNADHNELSPLKNPNISIENKLKLLECPFTWDIDKLNSYRECPGQPEILGFKSFVDKRMVTILNFFVSVVDACLFSHDDLTNGLMLFSASYKSLNYIIFKNELEGISSKALFHVVDACKCHMYASFGMMDKVAEILETIYDPHDMDINDRNTLLGFRGFSSLAFQPDKFNEEHRCLVRAVAENPNCAVWHYAYGMILDYVRRIGISDYIQEEIVCFKNVYAYAKSKQYLIRATEMIYVLNKNADEAFDRYKKILDSQDLCKSTYLQLALGFTTLKKKSLAEQCFDMIEAEVDDKLLHYYKGQFYDTFKQHKKSLKCFKIAIRSNTTIHYDALEEYCRVELKINKNFNVARFLSISLRKLGDDYEIHEMRILLHIAFEYLNNNLIAESVKYFRQVVGNDAHIAGLTSYRFLRNPDKNVNAYKFMKEHLFNIIDSRRTSLDETTLKACEELRTICKGFHKDNIGVDKKCHKDNSSQKL